MPRPFKCRCIADNPKISYFKPAGVPCIDLEEVKLTLDEFEAVRLADLNGLYQEDCAKKMKISRQTFGNIIEKAHKKIADAVVNGRALKIEGGVYKISVAKKLRCRMRGYKGPDFCKRKVSGKYTL